MYWGVDGGGPVAYIGADCGEFAAGYAAPFIGYAFVAISSLLGPL